MWHNAKYFSSTFFLEFHAVSFQIFDKSGKEIKKMDYGRMINVSDLKRGIYYITINGSQIYEYEKK